MSATHPRYTDAAEVADAFLGHGGMVLLEEYVAQEQARLRGKLEKMGLPDADANYIRGQIYTLGLFTRQSLANTFRHAQEGPDA